MFPIISGTDSATAQICKKNHDEATLKDDGVSVIYLHLLMKGKKR